MEGISLPPIIDHYCSHPGFLQHGPRISLRFVTVTSFVTHDNLSDSVETPSLLNIRAIAFFLPVALFIFVLSFVPLPAELTSYNPLTSTAARLVVLGTIILGLLSGLGAVNGAWSTFSRNAYVVD